MIVGIRRRLPTDPPLLSSPSAPFPIRRRQFWPPLRMPCPRPSCCRIASSTVRPTCGRPNVFFPSARTRSNPAITLDLIIDRSSSAKTVAICIIARPNGPVASMPCCSLISATPAASSSATCLRDVQDTSCRDDPSTASRRHRNRRRIASLSILSNAGRLSPALAAADPLILVFLDDLEPAMVRQPRQHDPLVFCGLAVPA